jgi:hypothetical protein
MTKGENVQLGQIGNQLAKLTQKMEDHDKLHDKLDNYLDKQNREIFGEGSDPGLRGEMDVVQNKLSHIWYLYGLLVIAAVGSVLSDLLGG